mmetsp:Transcript_14935/g.41281  ORF Transcript_14935/g.41281 Transcript_14935/m.41281 type:complete len:875 (-) Transcript_14935:68-2692(-)
MASLPSSSSAEPAPPAEVTADAARYSSSFGSDVGSPQAARRSMSSFGSDMSSPEKTGGATWEENARNCSLCGAKLGKRHLTPRHHCRICGRCICAACSPNVVQLQGQSTPQRACKECIGGFERGPEIIERIMGLGRRLGSLNVTQANPSSLPCDPERPLGTLDEALTLCEKAVVPIEAERERQLATHRRVDQLENEVRVARAGCVRLAQRIHALQRSRPPSELQAASLDEAVGMCEAALVPLEDKRLGREYVRRAVLDAELDRITGSEASVRDDEVSRRRLEQRTPLRSAEAAAATTSGSARDAEAGCSEAIAAAATPQGRRMSSPFSRPLGAANRCEFFAHRRRCCACSRQRVLVCMSSFLLAAAVALLILRLAAPALAQRLLSSATITLVGASMRDPTASSLRMSATVVIDNAGPLSVHVQSFRAEVGAGGRAFGWCTFPDVVTTAAGPTRIELDSELHVTDSAGFATATSQILQGQRSEWYISGMPSVTAVGLTMQLQISKMLHLPATLLKEVQSANIDVLSSSEHELSISADTTFFSSSVLEFRNFSQATFTLHPTSENGTVNHDVQMGYVKVPQFEVLRGFNIFKNVSIVLQKTATSEKHLSRFLGAWASGMDQLVVIRGPVGSASPFLNHLTTESVQIMGLASGVFKSGFVSSSHTLRGHVPETGKQCPLQDGRNCLKGAVAVVGNPLHHELRLAAMSFDVDMLEALSYETVLHAMHILPVRVKCSKGTRMARVYSTPGMWAYLDPSRAGEDSVSLPPAAEGGVALASFFLAARPQPGQSQGGYCLNQHADPMDCCFTTLVPAAACYYRRKAMSFVPASVRGNLTFEIGSFSISSEIAQTSFPITFTDDLLKFVVGPVTMSCDDFTFH